MEGIQRQILCIIVIMQNICNLIDWNNVHIFDVFNYYRTNINEMLNAEKLTENIGIG